MEKYAVDTTDSFERAASDMVKTGEAKNIDAARRAVDKEAKRSMAGQESKQRKLHA